MDLNLKGRVGVAAGGANGVGREIALALVGRGRGGRGQSPKFGGAANAVVGESEAEGVWAITCGARESLISMSFKRGGRGAIALRRMALCRNVVA